MLLENYTGSLEPRILQVLFGLGLGLLFGIVAQISRFCLRRAVSADSQDRGQAGAVWLTAFATALIGFQSAKVVGLIDLGDHRFLSTDLPVAAIVLGGLAFGVGMILTRGCVSRLTVLGASGNLRALSVLVIFAIVAHAMLKGVMSPLRTSLGKLTVELPVASLSELPLLASIAIGAAILAAISMVRKYRPGWTSVVMGGIVGLVAVLGWVGTSTLLLDEFDPLPIQSAAFTLPWSDTLFWVIASTAVPAGFGTGLIGGVLLGSFGSALIRGELALSSFETPAQFGRYAAGGLLMGIGGVLAGGCTVGAGLSGAGSLSIAAFLALASIATGGYIASRIASTSPSAVPA